MDWLKWVELVASVVAGLAVCIPLVAKLVVSVQAMVKEKNWSQLLNSVLGFMAEAEDKYADGATRKEWVMGMAEQAAKTANYTWDEDAKAKISEMIDNICTVSKTVNTK